MELVVDLKLLPANKEALWESIKAERDRRIQTGGYQAAGRGFT